MPKNISKNETHQGEDTIPCLSTKKQVAQRIGVHPKTISRWTAQGRLTPIYLSARTIRYRAEDVQALINDATSLAK
jgi:predicted site-specific integrase-resolvase